LSEEAIARIGCQILRALDYLHGIGVAHRDVKLENILLSGDNPIPDAFLGDFGFAAKRSDMPGEVFAEAVGSKPYCAPELLRAEPYTEAVDMWAFGVVLYVMFVHQMPFPDAEQYHEDFMCQVMTGWWFQDLLVGHGPSEAAFGLIAQCLQVDPSMRPTAAKALDNLFFQGLGGADVKAEIGAIDDALGQEV
jgi:calcium/calmodulin-dependent protein kinase I